MNARPAQLAQTSTRPQRGVAAVEFALVLFLLMVLVSGTVEFGRTIWYYNSLTKATRDGARIMSMVPVDQVTAGVTQAKDLVYGAAVAAGVPDVTRDHVEVSCLNSGFAAVTCANGTEPVYVRVAISGYNVVMGGWIALFSSTGQASTRETALAPHTTMRYVALN